MLELSEVGCEDFASFSEQQQEEQEEEQEEHDTLVLVHWLQRHIMMDPHYCWNPPIRTTLTAVGLNDTDDYQINIDDNDNYDDDQDDNPILTGIDAESRSTSKRMEVCPLRGDPFSPVSQWWGIGTK